MQRRISRKKSYRFYLFLALFFLIIFNIPRYFVGELRACCVHGKGWLTRKKSASKQEGLSAQFARLQRENRRLALENSRLRQAFLALEMESKRVKDLFKLTEIKKSSKGLTKPFFHRRLEQLEEKIKLSDQALFAQVIDRSFNSWARSLWIDLGQEDNAQLERPLIAINSPVLSGPYLIGLVEYVGKNRSRVRLITDPSTVVAVRVVRGQRQERELCDLLSLLDSHLKLREMSAQEGEEELLGAIKKSQKRLHQQGIDHYLAKGELCGTSGSIWRKCSPILKGKGFNYDFGDEEGRARDLRSGKTADQTSSDLGISLIKEGDLLVTSGLDGIFPVDLPVATVSKVDLLEEGAAWYTIKAHLHAGDLGHLESVTVLPSLEFSVKLDKAR